MNISERIRGRYELTTSQYEDLLREARGHLEDCELWCPPDSLGVLVEVDRHYEGGLEQFVLDISPLWEEASYA